MPARNSCVTDGPAIPSCLKRHTEEFFLSVLLKARLLESWLIGDPPITASN